jgi:hypothetical protein
MKNKGKIAIAAGAVLASALAVAPVQAQAATSALTGVCSQGFACAWDTSRVPVLFWEANGPADKIFSFDENITYVENLTGYTMYLDLLGAGGYGWATLPPHTGLTNLGAFVGNGTNNTTVAAIELG